jgi:hypothetical protein
MDIIGSRLSRGLVRGLESYYAQPGYFGMSIARVDYIIFNDLFACPFRFHSVPMIFLPFKKRKSGNGYHRFSSIPGSGSWIRILLPT